MAKKYNSFVLLQNNLHLVMRPILIMARILGLFPVTGIFSHSPQKLRFVLKSPYTLIVLVSVAGQVTLTLLGLVNLFEAGTSPRTFYKFVVYIAGTVCTLIILDLARHWPTIVEDATKIEKSLSKFNLKNMFTPCQVTAAVVFTCALVEHVLSIRFYSRLTSACIQGESLMESYYLYTMPAAAAHISFSIWSFVFLQVIFFQIIFVANFTDILIIIISFYLTAYFEELNDLIILYKHKSPSIWNVLRVHYTRLTRLVKLVDDNISSFVLFSFGSNMALICVQLFKILRKDLAHDVHSCNEEELATILTSYDRSAYFNFSIMFLIGRAIATALLATRVHASARAPLLTLYEVPSCCYNNEARRFVEQMHANVIALSGQHFFYVTRKMILTMVATIFTYELVLLQFSNK